MKYKIFLRVEIVFCCFFASDIIITKANYYLILNCRMIHLSTRKRDVGLLVD